MSPEQGQKDDCLCFYLEGCGWRFLNMGSENGRLLGKTGSAASACLVGDDDVACMACRVLGLSRSVSRAPVDGVLRAGRLMVLVMEKTGQQAPSVGLRGPGNILVLYTVSWRGPGVLGCKESSLYDDVSFRLLIASNTSACAVIMISACCVTGFLYTWSPAYYSVLACRAAHVLYIVNPA